MKYSKFLYATEFAPIMRRLKAADVALMFIEMLSFKKNVAELFFAISLLEDIRT